MKYHLASKNSGKFFKVMFALAMMFNLKDLSHWPVVITVYCLISTLLLDVTAWK